MKPVHKALHQPAIAAGSAHARLLERLLRSSSSSLSSSSPTALTLEGMGLRPQAAAPATHSLSVSQTSSALAQSTAVGPAVGASFSFDFFEKTQCISNDVRLIADTTQAGDKRHMNVTRLLQVLQTLVMRPSLRTSKCILQC